MFGKLMKYELRYLIRIFAPMWAAVFALCVMFRVTVGPKLTGNNLYLEGNEALVPAVIGVITVFAIMTMMVVATVVLIQRFYKGMYGDEGYLMFTLPVTSGQLIHSKALSALLMMLGTEVVTIVGIFVMVSFKQLFNGDALGLTFGEMWRFFLEMMHEGGVSDGMLALYIFWALFGTLLMAVAAIYEIYLAISLGQLWKKHPVAGALVAYYVLQLLFGGAQGLLSVNVRLDIVNNVVSGSALPVLIYMTVSSVVLLLVSFIGTKLLLDKKLKIA